MRFGVSHANIGRFADPAAATELAHAVEDAGFESLWTVDHVVLPKHHGRHYPETADGSLPFPIDHPIAEPLAWIAHVGAVTTRLRLGTGILVLPQRNPLVAAKTLATVDRMSGGRLDVGIGAGWLREEFDALGADFRHRGALLDEHLAAMRALWSTDVATHDGDHVRFSEVACSPRPVQHPLPVHVGGYSDVAARRAGRVGQGFFPGGSDDLPRLRELMARARAAATDAGRDPVDLEITTRWTRDPDRLWDTSHLDALAAAGVDRVLVPAWVLDQLGLHDTITRIADRVIPQYAAPPHEHEETR